MKKIFFAAFLALISALSWSATVAVPNEIKGKTISVIVPYGPGGNSDIMARLLAKKVTEKTGVATVVINKPGAGGNIGAQYVVTAKPDGLTVCQCETSPAFTNGIMGLPGSPVKGELVPVSANIESVLGITVRADLPVNTLKELAAYLNKNAKMASYGTTTGIATLWSEQFLALGAVKGVVGVSYKSQAEAVNALLAGTNSFLVAGTGDTVALAQAGKLKILAVGSAKRLPILPNIPTTSETYPKFRMTNYNGIFVPRGVSQETMEWMASAWDAATWDIDTVRVLHDKGISPIGGDMTRAFTYFETNYREREQLWKQFGSFVSK